VSKHLTKLRKANLISDRSQSGILITDRGVDQLRRIFGELNGGPPADRIATAVHVTDEKDVADSF
jgi:predicted transcriptional regulator